MKRISTYLVIYVLMNCIMCSKTNNPNSSLNGNSQVCFRIHAQSQNPTSTYKVTITGDDMDTIGPNEYDGGQTVELYVPPGADRQFHVERYTLNRKLISTGTTVQNILPGVNDIEITLQKITYSLSYYKDFIDTEGDAPIDTNRYAEGNIVVIAGNETMIREGYHFYAWKRGISSELIYKTGDTLIMNSEDVDLYPIWNKIYVVTYVGGDGVEGENPIDNKKYVHGDTTITKNRGTMKKPGYYFAGWSLQKMENDTNDGVRIVDTLIIDSSDVTLYAVWIRNPSYTIFFDKNDSNAYGTMNSQKMLSGTGDHLAPNTFMKDGWMFAGWLLEKEGTVAYGDRAHFTMDSADVVLYAKWTQNPVYTISFEKNDLEATGYMNTQVIVNLTAVELYSNTFIKKGFTFEGWAETPDGEVLYGEGADYLMENSNDTLYAQWIRNPMFTVSFDANDTNTTGEMRPQGIVKGLSVELQANAYEMEGWSFVGWARSPDGKIAYGDGAEYTMENADDTLYAKWTQNPVYMLTYDKNDYDATGEMISRNVISGLTVKLQPNTFEKAGWSFAGWASTPDGEVAYSDAANFGMDRTDVTLYAQWTQIPIYAVTFDKNDSAALGTMDAQNIESGSALALSSNAYTKTGWSFIGWAEEPDGEVVYGDGESYVMESKDMVLYAVWERHEYSLTFHINDTSATGTMAPLKIAYNDSIHLPKNTFVKPDYRFFGWSTDPSGEVEYYDSASFVMRSNDIALYALWEEIPTYIVTYNGNGHTDGSVPEDLNSYYQGDTITVMEKGSLVKNGHAFSGWYSQEYGAHVHYKPKEKLSMGSDNFTFLATWLVDTHTIVFNRNDENDSVDIQKVTYNDTINEPEEPTRDGYRFEGWYVEDTLYDFKTKVTSDITMHANWTDNTGYPDTLWVPVTFYDFRSDGSNPEFEQDHHGGVRRNMVADTLDEDGKPALGTRPYMNHKIEYWFRPWEDSVPGDIKTAKGDFNIPNYKKVSGGTYDAVIEYVGDTTVDYDTAFTNMVIEDSLIFVHLDSGVYQFRKDVFFPIDNKGFMKEGKTHNYSFTMELEWEFRMTQGLTFAYEGNDDTWAFIDNKLAMDLGGIHSAEQGIFGLDDLSGAFGLIDGEMYTFKLFFCERHSESSSFRVQTNIISSGN